MTVGQSKAQVFLEQVELLDSVIRNKLIEKEQWRGIALGITAHMDGERVQSSGAKSKMADAVAKCVDIEAEIDSLIDRLIDTKKEVIQTIEKLSSPMEYNIMHMRYIQYIPLKDIADEMGTRYTNITTIHGRALKNIERFIRESE